MAIRVTATIGDCVLRVESDGDGRHLEHVQGVVMQAVSGALEMYRGLQEANAESPDSTI